MSNQFNLSNIQLGQIWELISFAVIPISLIFIAERLFIYLIFNNENIKKWARNSVFTDPNNITRARYIMGVISVLIYHYLNKEIAIVFCGFWIISDLTDGSIARFFNKKTAIGEIIDPLSDKLLYFPPLFYSSIVLNALDLRLVITYFLIDFFGQFSRQLFNIKAANLFGKTKTFLTISILLAIFTQDTYFHAQLIDLSENLLIITILLAILSILFRIIPNYWYANVLSILNFCCGLFSIILVINGYPLVNSFFFIFLGQFLDLFDGRAAQKWGSTPRGEIFDDIADGTSFGLGIGFMIFYSIESLPIATFISLFYVGCTIYRLVRFLNDKKKSGEKSGVLVFNGLPSPAAALFAAAYSVLLSKSTDCQLAICQISPIVEIIPFIIIALMMISHEPYIHIGRTIIYKMPNIVIVLITVVFIIMCILSYRFKTFEYLMIFILISTITYLIFGNKRFHKLFKKN